MRLPSQQSEKEKMKLLTAPAIERGRKIGIIFIVVALLPVLVYSIYELSSLSSTEKLIESIYGRQLDVILYSINEYALDVAQSWSGEINRLLIASPQASVYSETEAFLSKREAIRGVLYADSTGRVVSLVTRQAGQKASGDRIIPLSSLKSQAPAIEKLLRYAATGYRKIEPVIVGDSSSSQSLLLLFVTPSRSPDQRIAGFLIDPGSFLTDVLQTKIEQTAGEEFLLAVFNRREQRIALSTAPVQIAELREVKDLWFLPGYSIGIRLKGTGVEDIARARSERNLVLIGILDFVLVGVVWLLYRTIKKEMELVRLKGDFVSNVSHELRTPLSLIRMFTETLSLKRVQTEEKKQEYYATILREAERLTHLINNILNFSRMEAGKKQYHFEPTSLNEVVGGVIKSYESQLTHEGFTTSFQLAGNLPAFSADREAVAEALINILDNAVKYSGKEKYVRIATGRTDIMNYVEVEDHGIGIDKHHHKKIFETFYRVSTGLTGNVKGSGLGLSLVRHIMDAHGGTIELESAPGKGSTFRLLFPAAGRSGSALTGQS
jgi:two-component system phosphate regulon sensor histidine kinase PhoR